MTDLVPDEFDLSDESSLESDQEDHEMNEPTEDTKKEEVSAGTVTMTVTKAGPSIYQPDLVQSALTVPTSMNDEESHEQPLAVSGASSVRRLIVSPLQSHLLLCPSHRLDSTYMSDVGPIEERQTTYEWLKKQEGMKKEQNYPIMMNTPDTYWNCESDFVAPTTKVPIRTFPSSHVDEWTDEQKDGSKKASRPSSNNRLPTSSPPAFNVTATRSSRRTNANEIQPSQHSGHTSPEADESILRPNFVQCTKCSKWRMIPDDIEPNSLAQPWQCDMNYWDSHYARCTATDEIYEDGDFWPGMPCRWTRILSHYQFYQRLLELHRNKLKHHEPTEVTQEDFDKFPTIRRKPVDLYVTYQTVLDLGGYEKVSASNQWRTVQSKLQIPDQHDSSATIKKMYKKFLFDYECLYWKNPRAKSITPPATQSTQTTRQLSRSRLNEQHPPTTTSNLSERSKRPHKSLTADDSALDDDGTDVGGRRQKRRQLPPNTPPLQESDRDDEDESEHDYEGEGGDGEGGDEDRLVDSHGRPLPSHVPRSTTNHSAFQHLNASVPVPTMSALNTSVKSLRSVMESKFRLLEKRMEDRFTKLESTILKMVRDGMTELKQEMLTQSQAAKQRQLMSAKDLDRKQDLLAKGMNMLISERLKANLPKLAQIKLRNSTNKEKEEGNNNSNNKSVVDPPTPTVPAAAASSSTSSSISTIPSIISPSGSTLTTKLLTKIGPAFPVSNTVNSALVPPATAAATNSDTLTLASKSNVTLGLPPSPQTADWVRQRLQQCDAICFDVDSTVSQEEGIDVLAEFLGAGPAVKAYTTQAMNGTVPFETALQARLDLIKPSKAQVDECVTKHPPTFSPGFLEFVKWLRSDVIRPGGIPIYLVSGGFRALIEPLRIQLQLPRDHVFANSLFFNPDGSYQSFDSTEFTSRSGGKARAVQHLIDTHGYQHMCMIGDGMTDIEACPPAKLMIGYGGIVVRTAVKEKAHYFVTDWKQIQALLKQPTNDTKEEQMTDIVE